MFVAMPFAATAAEVRVSEIWCLDPSHFVAVVRTAGYEGLGTPKQLNSPLLIPSGSDKAVNVETWRHNRPRDFAKACDKTFEALTGRTVEGDFAVDGDGSSDGTTPIEDLGVSAAAGVIAAGFGGVIAYFSAGKARQDERKYGKAIELGELLGVLNAETDKLASAVEAGTISEEERSAMRKVAIELRTRIPSSAQNAKAARDALEELLEASDADRKGAQDNVRQTVGDLIHEIHTRAVVERAEAAAKKAVARAQEEAASAKQ